MADLDWSPVFAHLREEVERLRTNNERRTQVSELQINDFVRAMQVASRELQNGIESGRVHLATPEMVIPEEKQFKVVVQNKPKRQIFKLTEDK